MGNFTQPVGKYSRAWPAVIVAPGKLCRIEQLAAMLTHRAEGMQIAKYQVRRSGLKRSERFLLGSVSAAVAARAHCSVEVVREKDKNEV